MTRRKLRITARLEGAKAFQEAAVQLLRMLNDQSQARTIERMEVEDVVKRMPEPEE